MGWREEEIYRLDLARSAGIARWMPGVTPIWHEEHGYKNRQWRGLTWLAASVKIEPRQGTGPPCGAALSVTGMFPKIRFRTRLALILFLTMALTSALLITTYKRGNGPIKNYVAGISQDLVAISNFTRLQGEAQAQDQDKKSKKAEEEDISEKTKNLLSQAGFSSITIITPSGQVVTSTNKKLIGKTIGVKRHRRPSKLQPINISAQFKDVNTDGTVQEKTYVVEFPLIQNDKVIGYVQVRGIGDEVDALLRRTNQKALTQIILVMLAGIFAAVYLAFLFTKPVDMLVEGARQVAHGNLYVSLPVGGGDEMGRLAQTFNQMVERLRETRQLQERLSEAEKLSLLGRFAGTVAHEVRNSLNFINLSIDQIHVKYNSLASNGGASAAARAASEIERNLTNVKTEIGRLNDLVNEFLTAGRQAPLQVENCSLDTVLKEAITLVEKQAHDQDVSLEADWPSELPVLQADARQLKTAFVNILTNAVQAMPQGGSLRVTTELKNGPDPRIEMRFADTGPGIPVEDRERIFAPYFSTKATGFGLGLAITRKVVEDHGGSIHVANHSGRGTVMVVELPVVKAPAEAQTAATPAPAA